MDFPLAWDYRFKARSTFPCDTQRHSRHGVQAGTQTLFFPDYNIYRNLKQILRLAFYPAKNKLMFGSKKIARYYRRLMYGPVVVVQVRPPPKEAPVPPLLLLLMRTRMRRMSMSTMKRLMRKMRRKTRKTTIQRRKGRRKRTRMKMQNARSMEVESSQ